MLPVIKNILSTKSTLIQNGLVSEYRFDEGSGQILIDYFGTNHGQLGSTAGSDTNDPSWLSGGIKYTSDDYIILPLLVNPNQDFTFYSVVYVNPTPPSGDSETVFSFGNSTSNTQVITVYRNVTNGIMASAITNDTGSSTYVSIPAESVVTGYRLLKYSRRGSTFYNKDVISGFEIFNTTPVTGTFTFDRILLGARAKMTIGTYSKNQPQYYFSVYNKANSNMEDKQMYRYIKKLLAKRGVSLD